MPMKAYWTEYFPWTMPPPPVLGGADAVDSFRANTSAFLQHVYNATTFPDSAGAFLRDRASPTYAVRYKLTMPSSVPTSKCLAVILSFPGQLYFGRGVRDFICAFAGLNQSTQVNHASTRTECQHEYLLGLPIAEGCIWLVPPTDDATMTFHVYFARVELQGPAYNWFKFAFRASLSVIIVYLVWSMYFVHYRPLVANLKQFGVDDDGASSSIVTFEVFVGDPTSVVLSHPLVSLVFVWDVWLSPVYFGLATIRVSQTYEWWVFFLGALGCGLQMWFAYFTMRYATFLIKRWRVEHWFAAVDPGLVALASVVFSGPMMWVIANTSLATYFYFAWSIFESIDVTTHVCMSIETFPGAWRRNQYRAFDGTS
ncbi:hypothetical protein DYB32_007307 [Aphanomyces invadans]|uniref:Uncharacterized protein n=1 Tax=Aphanomyces invadans TaxID=157072 RepID=A0A3R6VTP7_9STRA|nr:hypothetical protein DYB32_007307 [Aphanomyces invadans]